MAKAEKRKKPLAPCDSKAKQSFAFGDVTIKVDSGRTLVIDDGIGDRAILYRDEMRAIACWYLGIVEPAKPASRPAPKGRKSR